MKRDCDTCRYFDTDFDNLPCSVCSGVSEWEAMTNAEHIRSMTDEELAEWIVSKTVYQESAWSAPSYLNFKTGADDTLERAIVGTAYWLKQPYGCDT